MILHLIAENGTDWPMAVMRWIGDGSIDSRVLSYTHPALLAQLGPDDYVLVSSGLASALLKVLQGRTHDISIQPHSSERVVVVGESRSAHFLAVPLPLQLRQLLEAITPADAKLESRPEKRGSWSQLQDSGWLESGSPGLEATLEYRSPQATNVKLAGEAAVPPELTVAFDRLGNSDWSKAGPDKVDSPILNSSVHEDEHPQAQQVRQIGERTGASKGRKTQRAKSKTRAKSTPPRKSGIHEPNHPMSYLSVVSVLGPGGTGSSTVAMSIAQVLGQGSEPSILLDGRTKGELAFLNEAGKHRLTVNELISASRVHSLSVEEVGSYLEFVPSRKYRLLKASSNPHAWLGWDPESIDTTLDSLSRSTRHLVADLNGSIFNLEETGCSDTASMESLTKACLDRSDLVVIVAGPDTKGLYSLTEMIQELHRAGFGDIASLVVINRTEPSRLKRHLAERQLESFLETAIKSASSSKAPLKYSLVSIPNRSLERTHCEVEAIPEWICGPIRTSLAGLATEIQNVTTKRLGIKTSEKYSTDGRHVG